MTSMFDYDDDVNIVFDAKIAGKNLVAAKHELLTKTGDFLFMAHSERELAYRLQMVESDIEKTAYHKLSNVSDSKAKLVRAVLDEWQIRHASCQFCKQASDDNNNKKKDDPYPPNPKRDPNPNHPNPKRDPNPPIPNKNPNPKRDPYPINPPYPRDPDKIPPHTWDPNAPHAPIQRPNKIDNNPPYNPPHNPSSCKICDEYDNRKH